jgi:hypothetical protein
LLSSFYPDEQLAPGPHPASLSSYLDRLLVRVTLSVLVGIVSVVSFRAAVLLRGSSVFVTAR